MSKYRLLKQRIIAVEASTRDEDMISNVTFIEMKLISLGKSGEVSNIKFGRNSAWLSSSIIICSAVLK